MNILLEGSATLFGMRTNNEYYALWIGQCSKCSLYLKTYLDEVDANKMECTLIDEEAVEFLFGWRIARA